MEKRLCRNARFPCEVVRIKRKPTLSTWLFENRYSLQSLALGNHIEVSNATITQFHNSRVSPELAPGFQSSRRLQEG